MPDDFGSNTLEGNVKKNSLSGSLDSAESSEKQGMPPLAGSQTKSPLETAVSASEAKEPLAGPSDLSGVKSPDNAPVSDSASPSPLAPPDDKAAPGDSSPAPDTDDFLKSILSENNQPKTEAPSEPAPDNLEFSPNPNAEPVDSKSAENPVEPMSEKPELTLPPAEPESGKDENKSVSEDLITSMQKPPAPAKSYRVLSVVAIVVIVALAGYSIYSIFFAKPKTTVTPATEGTAVSSPTSFSTQTATSQFAGDEQRKADLLQIQQALISYAAGNGNKYPIAVELVNLNSPGNLLEKELVPNYLSRLPADSDSSKFYAYKSPDGKSFTLTAVLDNISDPSASVQGEKAIYTVTPETVPTYATPVPTATVASGAGSGATAATLTPETSSSFGF